MASTRDNLIGKRFGAWYSLADMLKLYTFNISHFSENARWALDYEGISFDERVLLPGPHQMVTRRFARRTSRHLLAGHTGYTGKRSAPA